MPGGSVVEVSIVDAEVMIDFLSVMASGYTGLFF
jgi:hypothetical protein